MTAIADLQAYVDRERAENGLIEISFTPGSDREVSAEDAAAVALAMIRYARDG